MENASPSLQHTMDTPIDLREREKELDFVYSLAALLSGPDLEEKFAAEQAADLFRQALTKPESARVDVGINGHFARSIPDPWAPHPGSHGKILRASAGEAASCWLEARYLDDSLAFSDRELALGESAARLLAISARRMLSDRLDSSLKQDLERKNAALSELLSRIELEKKGIRDSIAARLKDRILPLLGQMDAAGFPAKLTAEIRGELNKAVSGPSEPGLSLRNLLSSRELEICSLVAAGLSSKEIAGRLGLAAATVERHRYNARRKLGLPPRQGNLGAVHYDSDL